MVSLLCRKDLSYICVYSDIKNSDCCGYIYKSLPEEVALTNMDVKRVTLYRNGSRLYGKVIALPRTYEQLIALANEILGVDATALYTYKGGELTELGLVRDDEDIYVSEGEPFMDPVNVKRVMLPVPQPPMAGSEIKTVDPEEWVTLNVGGKYFSTTRSTLQREEDSMLARMFTHTNSHVWSTSVDPNGAYLIDRSPRYFEPILNYLRHGELVIDKNVNPQGVLEEAKFFGIASLMETLENKIQSDEAPHDGTPITRREFILRLMNTPSNCELRCQGLNFTGANLSKLDLRYVNFKYAVLRRANLCGANLSYCNFERADMSGALLNNSNLLGAKMVCVNLEGASLQGCNFEDPAGSRTNMEGANMKQVNLEGSHMAGVNLRVATLKNANLQNCDLRSAVLAGADLENCDLSGCDLHEANLRGANLKGAAFELMLNPLHMSQTVP